MWQKPQSVTARVNHHTATATVFFLSTMDTQEAGLPFTETETLYHWTETLYSFCRGNLQAGNAAMTRAGLAVKDRTWHKPFILECTEIIPLCRSCLCDVIPRPLIGSLRYRSDGVSRVTGGEPLMHIFALPVGCEPHWVLIICQHFTVTSKQNVFLT